MAGDGDMDWDDLRDLPGFDRFCDITQDIWPAALRFALDTEDAPARCGRRACRRQGVCRMRLLRGRPPSCGGGITGETTGLAAACAIFGGFMVMQVLFSGRADTAKPWLEEDAG